MSAGQTFESRKLLLQVRLQNCNWAEQACRERADQLRAEASAMESACERRTFCMAAAQQIGEADRLRTSAFHIAAELQEIEREEMESTMGALA